MVSLISRDEDIRASVLGHLEHADQGIIAVMPVTLWVWDGAADINTSGSAFWIEPTIRFVDDRPSRGALEQDVQIEVGVAVRDGGSDIHKREQIAALVSDALKMARIVVGDHSGGNAGTAVGHLRVQTVRRVNQGKVNGIHRAVVLADAIYWPGA